MADRYMSDTMRKLISENSSVDWSAEKGEQRSVRQPVPPRPKQSKPMSPAEGYGRMVRFITSGGTDKDFQDAFPNPTEKIRNEAKKRAMGR